MIIFNKIKNLILNSYYHRPPIIKNKYRLHIYDIKNLFISDIKKVNDNSFIRLDKAKAYVLSDHIGLDENMSKYTLIFFDNGLTYLILSSNTDTFYIKDFYHKKDIKKISQLQIQEKLIKRLNYLLDNHILEVRK